MKTKIWIALLALYIVWGSTYLAIRFSVETIPPAPKALSIEPLVLSRRSFVAVPVADNVTIWPLESRPILAGLASGRPRPPFVMPGARPRAPIAAPAQCKQFNTQMIQILRLFYWRFT